MRRVLLLTGALAIALPACTREHADTAGDAAPSASSAPALVPDAAPDVPPSTSIPPGPSSPPLASDSGAHVVGHGCSPGPDSIACTPDGLEVLTCASGQWRMLQSCRGPGHCVGVGSALQCDTGLPQPGDACVPTTSEPQCRNGHEAIACQGGKWMVTPCRPGSLCLPGTGKGHAGCK